MDARRSRLRTGLVTLQIGACVLFLGGGSRFRRSIEANRHSRQPSTLRTVVSSEDFSVFGIRIVRGRAFTAREADEGAALAMVSEATARTLWPGVDPTGQKLDLLPPQARSVRRPTLRVE